MFFKAFGLLKKIIYKFKFGKNVHINGIPRFIFHMQLYAHSGKMKFGKNFLIKQGVYIAAVNGGQITIGDNVSINRNCILVCHDAISIAENCAIGPNCVFYDHDHKFGVNGIEKGFQTAPIVIEKNCWIGAGVTILRGTHIGEGCVIGAGCVIKGNIPAHSLVKSSRELNISPIEAKEPNFEN